MKVYISSNDKIVLSKLKKNMVTDDFEKADIILILPGGLGTYFDLFKAINEGKKIYLYNKDFFYTPLIKNLYDLHLDGMIDKVPSEYINIESELDKIIEKIEER